MTIRSAISKVCQQEDINFLLTNRIPRRLVTRFMGWFSQIEQPLVRELSIATWRLFSDLDLSEARKRRFLSMHDCFTRELKDGARPVENDSGQGSIGAIGGIKQKTIGARAAHVDAFLVPAGDNAREARRYAHGLRIIPVDTFPQALRALATLGRNP